MNLQQKQKLCSAMQQRTLHFTWLKYQNKREKILELNKCTFEKKFLDAGIQDVSTSISIVHDLIEKHKFSKGRMMMMMMMMVMKVTNIYKHEIVDTRA